ncbi:MAG TPA: transaldolase [Bacteroidales bacterium]|nr:transaldolase [Bacteroidales bacterium]
MENALEQLRRYTRVVADTGDFESMHHYKPEDATTNPSLILQSASDSRYAHLLDEAIAYARNGRFGPSERMSACLDKLAVNFGLEILKIVPGRVSTEVDARLSFDTQATINKARQLIGLYESAGIGRERILIKIASTWEGIKAAEVLEKEGIRTNLTLLFSKIQAIACAQAGVQLISPFVGRILDWHKAQRKVDHIPASEDPGVISVTEIFNYFKHFGYKTEVMGASFRNSDEIIALAGCDLLTIAPSLLAELQQMHIHLEAQLSIDKAKALQIEPLEADEKTFRWLLNEDAMATEKLAEGIRRFAADTLKLEQLIAVRLFA